MAFTRDDVVKDTPTNTFATYNPLSNDGGIVFSNGNLYYTGTAGYKNSRATLGMSIGKWYWETLHLTTNSAQATGITNSKASLTNYIGNDENGIDYLSNGNKVYNGTNIAYGNSYTNGDIIGVLFDADNGSVFFYKNGVIQNSGNPAVTGLNGEWFPTATNASSGNNSISAVNFGQDPTFANNKVPTKVYTDASGYGRFFYEPPAGAMALCTANLDTANLQPAEYIVDETNQHMLTYNGNAQISKFSPYTTDGWSINFNGINQYLYLNKQAFDFGTGDFSFECFVYVKGGDNSNYQVLLDTRTGAAAQNFVLGLTPNNTLYWYSSSEIAGTEKVPPFKWTHILFARSGSTLKMYVNGKESYSAINTGNFNASNTTYGYLGKAIQGVGWVAGYMTEIRSVIGSCAYDISGSAITIPTSFLSVTTDTKLLISANNRHFLDTSTNNYDIFPVDGPSISDWSPFQRSNDFDTAFFRAKDNYYGGSFKFDGNGDKLDMGDNEDWSLSNGDFTFRFWMYGNNNSITTQHVFAKWNSNKEIRAFFEGSASNRYTTFWFQYKTSSTPQDPWVDGGKFDNLPITPNSWNYFVFVNSGGTTSLYVNGASMTPTNNTISGTIYNSTDSLWIGSSGDVNAGFAGYIADFEFEKTAISNPTDVPTNKVTKNSNTKLLLQPWHTKTSAGVMSLIDSYAQDEGGRNLYYGNGGVSITTANPYKSSSIGSFIFDGSNNSQNGPLKLPKDEFPFYNVGINDFTMEWWFKMNVNNGTGSSSYQGIFWAGSTSQGIDDPHVAVNNSTIQIYLAAQWQNTGFTPATGVWYHFALVRDYAGNSIKMFINGKQEFSTTAGAQNNYDQWNNASTLQTNCHFGNHGGYSAFEGLITDIRFVNNQALYTTGFTPPAYPLLDNKYSITGENPSTGSNITGTVMLFTQPGKVTKRNNVAAQDPDAYMKSVIYTGDFPNAKSVNVGFNPDLIWLKSRTQTYSHGLWDTTRTVNGYEQLSTNTNAAQATNGDEISFITNGFRVDTGQAYNEAGQGDNNMVAWCWKAGGTPSADGVAMVDGSATTTSALKDAAGASIIPTRMSVNTKAGFSIVKYAGTGTHTHSFPHGLTNIPDFVIIKSLGTNGWIVKHSSTTSNNQLSLNSSGGQSPNYGAGGIADLTSPNVINFYYETNSTNVNNVNTSGTDYIAYCWHSVAGYSAFGSYTGNGSSDGPFIYTGFRPAWVMVKWVSGGGLTSGSWRIMDTARNPYNPATLDLIANEAVTETTYGADDLDILSNGFKWRSNGSFHNTNGAQYIYAAWAEQPGKYSNAR